MPLVDCVNISETVKKYDRFCASTSEKYIRKHLFCGNEKTAHPHGSRNMVCPLQTQRFSLKRANCKERLASCFYWNALYEILLRVICQNTAVLMEVGGNTKGVLLVFFFSFYCWLRSYTELEWHANTRCLRLWVIWLMPHAIFSSDGKEVGPIPLEGLSDIPSVFHLVCASANSFWYLHND